MNSGHAHSIGSQTLQRLDDRKATIGVIGLGYVGLPLAAATGTAGFSTIGFDVDPDKPAMLMTGKSYIDAVKGETLRRLIDTSKFEATTDMARLSECDVIVICVPTPLTRHRDPDMSYIESTAETIAARMRRGQLIVLESTTYPGTTDGLVKSILEEKSGLTCGADFFLGFSPEREDPGNVDFVTATIPKVVAGSCAMASTLVESFYAAVVRKVVSVSSPATAEAVKITENVFRAVNIALVNELKIIYEAMGIDIWEVIEAAKTKPFGFMPFYPGPGLGGHCIPIDPFYLTWKAREFEVPTRFIELAGEINTTMPSYVVRRLEEALDTQFGKSLGQCRLLLIGLAYKKNVSDTRESPSLKLMELVERRGCVCDYHDPHVPEIPQTREHPKLVGRKSVDLTREALCAYDAALISTDHDLADYAALFDHAKLIVDTRNALGRRGFRGSHIIKA